MKTILTLLLTVCLALPASPALAQKPTYPPDMPGARTEVYHSTDSIDLKAWIFEPAGHSTDDARPCMVFYFGGGWNGGSPGQFQISIP